jgi:hydroxyacylglutathione hydrolase
MLNLRHWIPAYAGMSGISIACTAIHPRDTVNGVQDLERIELMPAEIRLFLCLKDNYGVLLHDPASGATASIDAPEAAPIEAALKATGWNLTDILVTHHHADHTAGILQLKEKYKCRVVAPSAEAETIPAVDLTVREGDKVSVGKLSANVIETPGHTTGHIAFWFHADKLAFVGDTLFSIGCGRVIEGTPGMMWRSLCKLRDLPDDTKIYCGHEYTAANILFARTIEPNNAALAAREVQVTQQIAKAEPTIPVTIGNEKLTNPFLRADVPDVAAGIGMAGKQAAQVFAEIRARKNKF